MAQTGYTPISIYYSATSTNVPTAGNLVAGELAINTADGKLFYKDSSGVVQTIAGKGGAGVAGGSTTQVQYNSSGSLAGSANMTFSGTALTLANDASISGLTVGKGGGAVASATVVGNGAMAATNTGTFNSAFGNVASAGNTSGTENTSIGAYALYSNTTGSYNTAVGKQALASNVSGGSNTAVGTEALISSTGSFNTAIGRSALTGNTTASNNVAVGYQAGYAITTGIYNTILGSQDSTSTTGDYNVKIGRFANASSSSASYSLMINTDNTARTDKGSSSGFIFVGGSIYQGNNSATWAITSDARLKKNIVDNKTGLDAINAIQVRNFEYRTADEITDLPKDQAVEVKGIQLGAIAQEIQAILPDCVKTESTGVMSVDTTNLTWYLINAVKELNAKITALENK